MRKSLFLGFVFIGSSIFVSASSQGSVFSNHGSIPSPVFAGPLFLDSYSDVEATQFQSSAESFATSTQRSSVGLPAAFLSPAESTSESPTLWNPLAVYPSGSDGGVDVEAVNRLQVLWLAHLGDESLQKKCVLTQEKIITDRFVGIAEQELLDEFIRRHPEGLSEALAGSKRRLDFPRSELDTLCEGVDGNFEGLFERFKTRDVDTCLACLNARNEEIEQYLLVTNAPNDEFVKLVDEQVEHRKFREMLRYKSKRDAEESGEVFVDEDARKGLQQINLITNHFPKSLVPYPVWPEASSDRSEKRVELK